ncbi:outer membrane beta-barrel protein [Sunxiuqinia sp. sy24]|uniref:outer membrane beta-barrel protein n=1 Tax=Sunxiuqinia sp. sy24 TaxID=3461495 RepID=UPI00404577E5
MNHFKFNQYKPILIAAILLLAAGTAKAQYYQLPKGELSVYLKGLNSKLNIDMGENGDSDTRYGAGFGVQYNYYFARSWSFSGALEYQSYRSKTTLDNFTDSYSLSDAEGDDMIFRSSASVYQEWQSVGMLNIPLRIQWETKGHSTKLFSATGIQLGLPLVANYTATAFGLETSGYFPQWDAHLTSPRFMGFGSWKAHNSGKEKLKLKTSYSFLFELGIKRELKAFRHLYVSAYVELGLNDLVKGNNPQAPLIGYDVNNPTEFQYASLIYSSPQTVGDNYVHKVTSQSFGFRMRYAFSW